MTARFVFAGSSMRVLVAVGALVMSACADELVAPLFHPAAPQPMSGTIDSVGVALDDLQPVERLGPPYPIILVHGFSGFSEAGPVAYFFEVKDDLETLGNDVTSPALPPVSSSAERARVLATVVDAVLARTQKAKVHIIAHSQGGIDARVLVGGMGYGPFVASVTTISTPHFGTAIAELAGIAPEGVLNPAGSFLAWLLGAAEGEPPSQADWASDATSDAWTPALQAAFTELTADSAAQLRADHPMPAGVPFFTVAGVTNLRSLDSVDCAAGLWPRLDTVDDVDPFLLATGTVLSFTDGGTVGNPTANDGLVTVRSARAPDSTFLGCVPADHADEIGQFGDFGAGILSDFDHRQLYENIVAHIRTVE